MHFKLEVVEVVVREAENRGVGGGPRHPPPPPPMGAERDGCVVEVGMTVGLKGRTA